MCVVECKPNERLGIFTSIRQREFQYTKFPTRRSGICWLKCFNNGSKGLCLHAALSPQGITRGNPTVGIERYFFLEDAHVQSPEPSEGHKRGALGDCSEQYIATGFSLSSKYSMYQI